MGMRGCREGVERCRGMPQVVESPRKDGVRPHALKNSRTQRSWNQRPWWMRWIASAKKVGVQKLSSPCPVPAQRHRAMAAEAQSLGPSSREGWLCDDPVLPTLEDVPDFLPPRSFMMSADFAASLTPAGTEGGGGEVSLSPPPPPPQPQDQPRQPIADSTADHMPPAQTSPPAPYPPREKTQPPK